MGLRMQAPLVVLAGGAQGGQQPGVLEGQRHDRRAFAGGTHCGHQGLQGRQHPLTKSTGLTLATLGQAV